MTGSTSLTLPRRQSEKQWRAAEEYFDKYT